MAKRVTKAATPKVTAPKETPKPVVKAQTLPTGLVENFAAKPERKEAYLMKDGTWKFNKVYADRDGEYEIVKNPNQG